MPVAGVALEPTEAGGLPPGSRGRHPTGRGRGSLRGARFLPRALILFEGSGMSTMYLVRPAVLGQESQLPLGAVRVLSSPPC